MGASAEQAQGSVLWQAADACLAMLLAIPLHQSTVEGLPNGGPWISLYHTAASAMFSSLCRLGTGDHPLLAQVSKDVSVLVCHT